MGFLDYLPTILNNIWLYGIIFVATITFIIFIHELGHYLVARWCGVRPELFSLGFGRELIGHTDKNGTRWSLRLYPFGGYVRMFGEQAYSEIQTLPPEQLEPAYFNKSVGKRALITAAGPAMNFIFALLLLICVYMTIGRPAPVPFVAALEINGPAHKAGIQIGDIFQSIDGHTTDSIDVMKALVAPKTGIPIEVAVLRGDQPLVFTVTPKRLDEENSYGFKTFRGTISAIYPNYGLDIREIHAVAGVDTKGKPDLARKLILENVGKEIVFNFGKKKPTDYLAFVQEDLNLALKDSSHKDFNNFTLGKRPMETMKSVGLMQALSEAADLVWSGINKILGTIFQIIVGTEKTTEMGGVIKISTMTADMAGKGLFTFLSFMALLSVSIGIINLLPIPMLDGGHLMFQLVEAIKGSPVSLTTKGYVYGFGLIFLLLAVFVINMNDFMALLKRP